MPASDDRRDLCRQLSIAARALPVGQRRAFRAYLVQLAPKPVRRKVHSWHRKSAGTRKVVQPRSRQLELEI